MTYQRPTTSDNSSTLPKPPGWVTSRAGETPHNVAFLSGAGFAMLDMVLRQSSELVPKTLLVNTLALRAAVATSKLEGRLAREADIRDAYHLTPPDTDGIRHWGPDGDVLDFWRGAVRLRLGGSDWMRNVADHIDAGFADSVEGWLSDAMEQTKSQGPLMAATNILRAVLESDDRAERIGCLLADMVLAKFFGWERLLPLTALQVTKGNLRDLEDRVGEFAIHDAISKSTQTTYRLAMTLAERATAVHAVAPKLRSKGSDAAINLFLSEDAIAPSGMLSPIIRGTTTPMTGRAARRLCDRLVELGVIKELTGRSTFRLYGVPL
ncbi:MAG: DUF1403 family protein [Pelagimonas sp.]|uniref:DUF1403 family protein n=1 Tax=Pelagimonas sp. TaxID=2073170 RepID=UPI003D6B1A53